MSSSPPRPTRLQTVRHGRTRVLANRHEIPVAESLSNPDASLQVEGLLAKLEFAAGADRVETMDAQQLAHDFLGDSIVSNVLAMGYAWQRGLVPVGLAAMLRALELNGVAVESNKAAFSLGRLAAADPAAARELLHEPDPASLHAETLDELIERSARFLAAYQNAGLRRALSPRRAVGSRARAGGRRRRTRTCRSAAPSPNQLRKLMAYKDEYEVARLYTDGVFAKELAEQFEGDLSLEFYMAPPALREAEGRPRRGAEEGPLRAVADADAEGAGARQGACAAPRSTRSAGPRSGASSAA